jgi:GNAT superfamily N-acetyltransferase
MGSSPVTGRAVVFTEPPIPGYRLSDERPALDLDAVHAYLTTAYWSEGISKEAVAQSVEGALVNLGLFDVEGQQVGFARAVGDGATFAWIADVYVLEEHRGRGLATWMMGNLMAHRKLHGVRRVVLATRDAHGLYEKVGFGPLPFPERWMQLGAGR